MIPCVTATPHSVIIRGILIAFSLVLIHTHACAAEVRFHATVLDEQGAPMPDIVVAARARGKGAAAVTNENGLALVSLDVDEGVSLAVVGIGGFDLLGVPEFDQSRLERRSFLIASARPREQLIRLIEDVADYPITLRFRSIQIVHAVLTEKGNPVNRLWEVGTPTSGLGSPRTQPDGSFALKNPVGEDVLMEINPHSDSIPGWAIIARVSASSIGPDGDMGTIDVDPTVPATGQVVFHLTKTPEEYQAIDVLFEASFWGITLVKSDGRTVMSFFADSDLHIANDPAVMPVGTWYVVPGSYFCWTWTQRRIVEACLDGVDLSTSGIPSITVTEGANMEVNIDPVAAELAIQNYFTPPQ